MFSIASWNFISPFEQGFGRALDVGRKAWECLLLHSPVEILNVKHLGVNVCLDVIAEAAYVPLKLVDRTRDFESMMQSSCRQSRNPFNGIPSRSTLNST